MMQKLRTVFADGHVATRTTNRPYRYAWQAVVPAIKTRDEFGYPTSYGMKRVVGWSETRENAQKAARRHIPQTTYRTDRLYRTTANLARVRAVRSAMVELYREKGFVEIVDIVGNTATLHQEV